MEPEVMMDAMPLDAVMPGHYVATPGMEGMDAMPVPLKVFLVLLYAAIYLGAPILLIIAAKKNWNGTPEKTKVEEFTGFWRRVAISIVDGFLNMLIVPILFSAFYYLRDGQTLADKIYGTKIVDKKTHQTASVGKLLIRPIAKIFSVLALGVGYWVAGWNDEKRAWHDGLADVRYVSYKKVHGFWTWLPILLVFVLPVLLVVVARASFEGVTEVVEMQM